jgi:hypothetical protein
MTYTMLAATSTLFGTNEGGDNESVKLHSYESCWANGDRSGRSGEADCEGRCGSGCRCGRHRRCSLESHLRMQHSQNLFPTGFLSMFQTQLTIEHETFQP